MKSLKKLFFGIAAIALVLMIVQCTKDSNGELKMGATIDGKSWESSLRVTTIQGGKLFIAGASLSGEALVIFVNGKEARSYTLQPLAGSLGTWAGYKTGILSSDGLANDSTKYAMATSGNVVITKIDTVTKLVSGTFNFVTKSKGSTASKTITNGVFNNLTIIKSK